MLLSRDLELQHLSNTVRWCHDDNRCKVPREPMPSRERNWSIALFQFETTRDFTSWCGSVACSKEGGSSTREKLGNHLLSRFFNRVLSCFFPGSVSGEQSHIPAPNVAGKLGVCSCDGFSWGAIGSSSRARMIFRSLFSWRSAVEANGT